MYKSLLLLGVDLHLELGGYWNRMIIIVLLNGPGEDIDCTSSQEGI